MKKLWLLLPILLIAGLGGGTPAYAVPPPLSQFGVSDGDLVDAAGWTELQNISAVLTPNGASDNSFFRGAVHWAPTQTAGPNWTTYDAGVLHAWQDGLVFLPEIHTSIAGGGGYINPLTCSGPGCGTTAFEAAVESIAARYGPGGQFSIDHPGFPGITRYEVWNEPNTNTGSIASSQSNDSDPAQIDAILHAESVALQAAAAGWTSGQLQIACCAFGNPGNGNHAYSLSYFKTMIAVPGNTVWSDISPPGALPGVITVHMYYPADDPSNCPSVHGTSETSSGEKCPQFLENSWAPYIHTSQGQPNVGMGITEGGYSGPINCSSTSPGTVSEQQQSDWDAWTINYYRSVPDVNMQFLAYYEAMDDDVAGDTGHSCWQPGLAAVTGTGAFKPWGTTFQTLIATDANQPPPTGASDSYSRNVATGWGTADVGGAYSQTTGPSGDLSVNGTQGVIVESNAAKTDTVTLPSMLPVDSQTDGVDVTFPAVPTSGNTTLIMDSRTDATGDYYKASFQEITSGYVTVTIRSTVGGVSTILATQTQFCKVQAGTPYHFEFDLTGDSPTSLYAGCYVSGGTPKGITASDSTAGLQQAGGFNLAMNPGAALNVPYEADFDNLNVAGQ